MSEQNKAPQPAPEQPSPIVEAPGRWQRLLPAVALAGPLLAGCGLDIPGRDDGALPKEIQQSRQDNYGGRTELRMAEHNPDPRFSATSVLLMDKYFDTGVGSLVKDEAGYRLVTVEHVARPLWGQESIVQSGGHKIGTASEPKKSESIRANIPHVGVMELKDDQAEYIGPPKDAATDAASDRYAVVELNKEQQALIAEREEKGVLSVPELASIKGEFGDAYSMPLPETGQKVPFVFISQQPDGSAADLAPLYVLDRKLDYQKGMQRLVQTMDKLRTENAETGNIALDDVQAAAMAVRELSTELLKEVGKSNEASKEAAKYLPCMGDSGSPLLDRGDNIAGVLSSGEAFADYDAYKQFDAYVITREGVNRTNRYCLSPVRIVAPPK